MMVIKVIIYLIIFWVMQVIAQILFKYGSLSERNWLIGFIGGNLFGFSSIWLLMLLYKNINVNVALGLAGGGAFLLSQIVLAVLFRTSLTPVQWMSVVLITIGMIGLCLGDFDRLK